MNKSSEPETNLETPAEIESLAERIADRKEVAVLEVKSLSEASCLALKKLLEAKGLRVEILDGSEINSKAKLMDALAEAHGYPGYFGKNWDALHDVFTDPRYWIKPVPEAGLVTLYRNSTPYKSSDPEGYEILAELISEASADWAEDELQMRFVFVFGQD